jgi:hypothetical protein
MRRLLYEDQMSIVAGNQVNHVHVVRSLCRIALDAKTFSHLLVSSSTELVGDYSYML